MQKTRTNPEWVLALSGQGSLQAEAIEDLRDLLLRAALFTLTSHLDALRGLEERERVAFAEDCAQEALLAVLDHLEDFRGESKFTTWAYKFAVNIALTRARRERWKQVSLDELVEEGDALDWLEHAEGKHAKGSDLLTLQSEVRALIQDVFRFELSPRQRQVLRWIAFDGVPMDVVVERLDSNRNAIYKLLHDARLKVRRRLAAQGYEVGEVYELFQQG